MANGTLGLPWDLLCGPRVQLAGARQAQALHAATTHCQTSLLCPGRQVHTQKLEVGSAPPLHQAGGLIAPPPMLVAPADGPRGVGRKEVGVLFTTPLSAS